MARYKKFSKRERAMTPEQRKDNDMKYIIAARHGFNKSYCSSKVKFFTAEEIAEYSVALS